VKRLLVRVAVLVAVLVPAAALAYGVQTGQTTTVAKGDTKSGTFYAAGQTVTVDGDINGDLICAGQTVHVNGAVHGDVLCAGQTITVNGPVDGNVRLAGQTLDVNGTVGRNVTVVGQTFALGGGANVAGDLGVATQSATLSGPVAKTVYGATGNLTIDNKVGDVDAQVANSLSATTLIALINPKWADRCSTTSLWPMSTARRPRTRAACLPAGWAG
jgi:cytoskeletal protein CcmA (bactofilin family)